MRLDILILYSLNVDESIIIKNKEASSRNNMRS